MSEKSSIYIVTYQNDLPWFKWCLASISRFWAEDSFIHVNVDPTLHQAVVDIGAEVAPDRKIIVEPYVQWGNNKGYMFQQWAKLTADQRTNGEWIAFFDSDLIINRTIGLSTFMAQDKSKFRWYYEPYSSVATSEPGATKWLHATWRAFNIRPEYEFMRRHPFILHRDTIAGCRQYLEGQHGPLADYLLNLPGNGTDVEFSEFNCLGFYAWLFHADRYSFIDVTKEPPGPSPVDQHHSWTGDPEQAHGRFLQACEAADFYLAAAKKAQERITAEEYFKPREQENVKEDAAPVAAIPSEETAPVDPQAPIDDPFEQDLAKIGFVKKENGEETYEADTTGIRS